MAEVPEPGQRTAKQFPGRAEMDGAIDPSCKRVDLVRFRAAHVKREEFAKVLGNALEIAGAHSVRIDHNQLMERSIIHVLDRDEVLWRIEVQAPR